MPCPQATWKKAFFLGFFFKETRLNFCAHGEALDPQFVPSLRICALSIYVCTYTIYESQGELNSYQYDNYNNKVELWVICIFLASFVMKSCSEYWRSCYLSTILIFPDKFALADILIDTHSVSAVWKNVFIILRVNPHELDAIERVHWRYPSKALEEATNTWLAKAYDVGKYGPPSWKKLVEAISHEAGGDNPRLAREIAKKHPA